MKKDLETSIILFSDSDEGKYRQSVNEAVRDAMDFHFLKTVDLNLSVEELEKLAKRKKPIYVDAIRRGYPILEEKLSAGPLDIETFDKQFTRRYELFGDNLRWQIFSTSEDPFSKLEYYKKLKAQNIELNGTSEIWTDPYIVYEMLKFGTFAQDQIYGKFLKSFHTIEEARSKAHAVLKYVPSPFEEEENHIIQAYARINKLGKSTDEKKDYFVSRYILGSSLPNYLDKTEEHSQEIINLRSFFVDITASLADDRDRIGSNFGIISKRTPPSDHNIEAYENSFAVELLIKDDKDPLDEVSIREPQVNKVRLYKALSFLSHLKASSNYQEFKENIYLVSCAAIEEYTPLLNSIFNKLRVSEEIGYRYIFRMLFTRLSNLYGVENLDPNAPLEALNLIKGLNYAFKLEDPIINRERVQETVFDKTQFIYEFFENGRFKMGEFNKLSKDSKKDLLWSLISTISERRSNKTELTNYDVLKKLANVFSVRFNITDKKFKLNNSATAEDKNNSLLFLGLLLEKIQFGFTPVINSLERIITEAAVNNYLRHNYLSRKEHTFGRLFSSKIRKILNGCRWAKISDQESLDTILANTSSYILSYKLTGLEPNINYEKEVSRLVLDEILNLTHRSSIQINKDVNPEPVDHVIKRFIRIADAFRSAGFGGVNKLKSEFERDYFGSDDPFIKKEFLVKTFWNSIKSIHGINAEELDLDPLILEEIKKKYK